MIVDPTLIGKRVIWQKVDPPAAGTIRGVSVSPDGFALLVELDGGGGSGWKAGQLKTIAAWALKMERPNG